MWCSLSPNPDCTKIDCRKSEQQEITCTFATEIQITVRDGWSTTAQRLVWDIGAYMHVHGYAMRVKWHVLHYLLRTKDIHKIKVQIYHKVNNDWNTKMSQYPQQILSSEWFRSGFYSCISVWLLWPLILNFSADAPSVLVPGLFLSATMWLICVVLGEMSQQPLVRFSMKHSCHFQDEL